ncbi:MAG TPA: hypothetical protein VFB79_11295 [Candidatus Angelobacter sp.]|nr:hypothetical protein [Candidatus Angelobacter sp.]
MTIVIAAIAGIGGACILSVILYVVARRRVRRGVSSQKAAIVGAVAPFLGLLWFVVAFLIHVQISNRIAHQDCGLSGDPYVTLPNGYVLGSLNTYDGYIKAPGYETDTPLAGPGYVRSIIKLNFSDPYFVGTQFDFKTSSMRNFVFDTRTREFHASEANSREGHPLDASSPAALDAWADAQTHAARDPDSYWKLYDQYRHRWPKYVFLALVIAGEVGIFFWFRRGWMRLADSI